MLISTTLAPVGVAYTYEIIIPVKKHAIEITAEQTVTLLNFLNRRIELKAGKIIRLEISTAPIIRMPSTMVRAVKRAMSILYSPVLIPLAFAKVSSKVTENNLLYNSIKRNSTVIERPTLRYTSDFFIERILPKR
jgi:hypothetical protein